MEIDGLGMDWVSGNIPNAWLSFWRVALTLQKAFTFNKTLFWKLCMLETNRPTQNDRNDQEIISMFLWKDYFILVFTDRISLDIMAMQCMHTALF